MEASGGGLRGGARGDMLGAMRRRGFANPEHLITLTVVAIALAIAVPAVARARERARNLRALQELRAALARYDAATKTRGPGELSELVRGGYLASIPAVSVMGRHARSARVREVGVTDDSGGWTYSNWPGAARQGEVWINCTHTDSRGKSWDSY